MSLSRWHQNCPGLSKHLYYDDFLMSEGDWCDISGTYQRPNKFLSFVTQVTFRLNQENHLARHPRNDLLRLQAPGINAFPDRQTLDQEDTKQTPSWLFKALEQMFMEILKAFSFNGSMTSRDYWKTIARVPIIKRSCTLA